jgi:aspartate-semialdehyde dehydrogenase
MAAMPVLKPLDAAAGLERLIVSTYQAVSGSGLAGRRNCSARSRAWPRAHARPRARRSAVDFPSRYIAPIAFDVIPSRQPRRRRRQRDRREKKLRNESRKILELPDLASPARACAFPSSPATRCRSTPSSRRHHPERAREILASAPGVVLEGGADAAAGSRQRPELRGPHPRRPVGPGQGLVLFVSNDNLRKGAALNAVQIAEIVGAPA